MPENTGGAGGFHEGMNRAVAAGFDWLWLMDDDLLTAPDALETLVRKKNALQRRATGPFSSIPWSSPAISRTAMCWRCPFRN